MKCLKAFAARGFSKQDLKCFKAEKPVEHLLQAFFDEK
jgi:hypothetical protein